VTTKLPTNIPLSNLQPLWSINRACSDCNLRAGCEGPVPGEGPTSASVMFIGESPGVNEDKEGFPFRGKAGLFFNHLLDKIVKIPRSDIWVTNTVKCHPPSNRDPLPD